MKIRNLLSALAKRGGGRRASDAQHSASAPGRPAPRRRRVPRGAPPGTIVVDPSAQAPSLRAFGYGDAGFEEIETDGFEAIAALRARWPRIWIGIEGLGDAGFLTEIGRFFGLHALALEDVVNVYQHAKVDQFPGHAFVVSRLAKPGDPLDTDQISLFVGEGFVLSFEERRQPFFDPVRARVRQGARRVLGAGTDYLAYLLLDNVVDSYFPVLEEFGERIDRLEDELLLRPSRHSIRRIHRIKKELLQLRRAIWPHREMLADLLHSDEAGVSEDTRIHLRDCQDHVVQILDLIETYRETCADLMDVYMSSASNRMGEVMKVLTVITTIFIPLSFVAGVYGMNFDPAASPWSMPELRWAWGYPACLGAMALIAISLLVYFWRKGWLGSDKP